MIRAVAPVEGSLVGLGRPCAPPLLGVMWGAGAGSSPDMSPSTALSGSCVTKWGPTACTRLVVLCGSFSRGAPLGSGALSRDWSVPASTGRGSVRGSVHRRQWLDQTERITGITLRQLNQQERINRSVKRRIKSTGRPVSPNVASGRRGAGQGTYRAGVQRAVRSASQADCVLAAASVLGQRGK